MENLAALVAANEEAAAAIAAAYEVLLGGVPNIAGFEIVINSAIAAGITDFNQENIFINVVNSLVQGNPTAEAAFNSLIAGQASLSDKVVAMYKALVPAAEQKDAGILFLTSDSAMKFYSDAVIERGIEGPNGEAIAALAVILNVLYSEDIGLGDDVNDLLAAIANGSAQLPASGDTFTPIEDADGTDFDDDDADLQGGTFNLTTGADFGPNFAGTGNDDTYNAGVVQTALIPNQTLNSGDNIDGGGGRDTLWAQLVDFVVAPQGLTSIEHLSLENAPIALGLAVGDRVVDAIHADSIDEVSFRSPNANIVTGLGVTNVSTVVNTVNINDSNDAEHFIEFIGTALDGDADQVTVNLSNVIYTALGLYGEYELATINSTGPVANSFSLYIETLEELTVIGDADLYLGWMEIDPLVLVDASTFEGDLTVVLVNWIDAGEDGNPDGVNDVIEVIGGLGDDDIGFEGDFDSDATVSLGEGDDVAWFESINGAVTFTETDSVDGGDGEDWLSIEAEYNGGDPLDLLLEGVGDNIVDVEGIEHYGELDDNLFVDWTRSGSATILELDGYYDGYSVIVTGLTNDDTVSVYGDDIYDLSLTSLNGGGSLSNEINLEFNVDESVDRIDIWNDLIVDTDTEMLNLAVNGLGYVEIDGADLVDSDITITGDADLSLGVENGAYDLVGGTIDASAATGDLVIQIDGQVSISGGSGDDNIIVMEADVARVFLAEGGEDVVSFIDDNGVAAAGLVIDDFVGHVSDFLVADDEIELSVTGSISPFYNAAGVAVVEADALSGINIEQGDIVGAAAANNFIKLTTAVDTSLATADTFDEAFATAIGGGRVENLTTATWVLVSFYDSANEQMVLGSVDVGANTNIDATDAASIWVVSTVGMSAADYAAFNGTNLDFIA